ncbi:MAG: hypothetical protein GWP08_20890 [Nitrospiraceae bacterium]|nr:hypothetical protein [Nitrospiraceae bacterium]
MQRRACSQDLDPYGGSPDIKSNASGFFRIEKMRDVWWLITPDGHGFLCRGINHIDSAALKHPDNIHLFEERYGDEETWIREGVVQPLLEWGFNAIAWNQEVFQWRGPLAPHTPVWRHERYQWAGVPYVHTIECLPFQVFNERPLYLDVSSREFEDYVDWACRDSCVEMRDDPRLIGYVFCRAPAWDEHPAGGCWAGDLDLTKESGQRELRRIALRYYQVCCETVRRYDTNHLLLGDDFRPTPRQAFCVYDAAAEAGLPILCVHGRTDFENPDNDAAYWHARTGGPVIMSDQPIHAEEQVLPVRDAHVWPATQRERADNYREGLCKAFSLPYVIGWNWDAWIENRERRSGIKTFFDEPYHAILPTIIEANREAVEIHAGSGGEEPS